MSCSSKHYQFIIPKRDSNLLRFLNQIDIIYHDDEAVLCIKNEQLYLHCDSGGVTINSIINTFQDGLMEAFRFDQKNEDDNSCPEINIPTGLYYILSLSYMWSKIIHSHEKKMFLRLILRYVELLNNCLNNAEKSQVNNLFNMLIFSITNIVLQEFDILEASILEARHNARSQKDIKTRKRKNTKYDYEVEDSSSNESETEFQSDQWNDNYQLENTDLETNMGEESCIQTDQVVNDSTVLEISFLLVKFLIRFSNHYLNINFSVVGLSEWSLILSLRIINFVRKFSNNLEVEAFNNLCKVSMSKWENMSETLLINILKSIKFTDKDQKCDENCLQNGLFEVIANCFINGCIDLIYNVNNVNNPNNRNNMIYKDFPSFISTITSQISEEFSNNLFVYILENLGTYWNKMDKIEDIGEDNNIVHISSYVESVSRGTPNVILKNISLIRKILNVMISYKLRSCFISSIASSLIEVKNRNEAGSHYYSDLSQNVDNNVQSTDFTLESRPQIIESIDLMLERVYDKHYNCRTRAIQSLQTLFINDIIPYSFFITILKEIKVRTLDESSYVRSSSFSLLRTMVRKATENYYHLPLNHEQISSMLNNVNDELNHLNRSSINRLNKSIINSNATSVETAESHEMLDQNLIKKKESEYELMKILLLDAKEVSMIVEDILESVCIHGIYSKINSDVSSCILFICESVSLNIVKGQSYISSVLKCIWRVNNVNILNSLVHGFFIILFNNACGSSVSDSQEHHYFTQNDLDNDDHYQNLKLQFSGKVAISQSSVRNLLKMMELLNDDDLMNLSKLLEQLTSKNTQISKKYTSSFDLSLLKSHTLSEISSAVSNLLSLNAETESYLKMSLELLFVIMKVESLNNSRIFDMNDNKSSFEVLYRLFLDSISAKNYSILECSVKCLSLIEINDQACTSEILSKYAEILSNVDFRLINTSLLIGIVNSVFMLVGNPSNIKYLITEEGGSKVLYIDLFINRLFGHYHKRLKSSKEITLIELSQVTNLLSHVIFKYGNFVENLYNKWKYLHSVTVKKSQIDKTTKPLGEKSSEFGLINLEEEYLEYIQMILESQLLSNNSVFYFIVPIVDLLTRDPSLLVDNSNIKGDEGVSAHHQWQLDYSRNCALISLCKLTSLTTKMLNIHEKVMDKFLPTLESLSTLSKSKSKSKSSLFDMPNIQLIFSFLYNPSSFSFISKTQLDHIMLNIILCTNDLLTRYPNIIDPWMEKLYTFLNSGSDNLRDDEKVNHLKYNIMLIINYLLNIGFVKPRDILILSYLKCISKTEFNSELSGLANSFFQEFFKDLNNQLAVNVIPLLINQLAFEYSLNYAEKTKTQTIIYQTQYLLHFVSSKDMICSSLIPKLFSRISLLNDPKAIELYVIAFEALKLGSKAKCIAKIIENFSLIAFHIQEFDILRSYFAKILQNNVNSNQNVHSEIISLLKDENIKSDKASWNSSTMGAENLGPQN